MSVRTHKLYQDEIDSLKQQIQQLQKEKEELEKILHYYIGDIEKNETTKSKLERVCKELLDIREQNNGLDYVCENFEKENQNLKQTIEKIKKYIKNMYDCPHCQEYPCGITFAKELKQLLESKEPN